MSDNRAVWHREPPALHPSAGAVAAAMNRARLGPQGQAERVYRDHIGGCARCRCYPIIFCDEGLRLSQAALAATAEGARVRGDCPPTNGGPHVG